MRIYRDAKKPTPGFVYWGNYGEIDMGWSYGEINSNNKFGGEPLHYHKEGTMYFLGLSGIGLIEVDGNRVELPEKMLLRIEPMEKYKVLAAKKTPFKFIAVCSLKDPNDKVIVE